MFSLTVDSVGYATARPLLSNHQRIRSADRERMAQLWTQIPAGKILETDLLPQWSSTQKRIPGYWIVCFFLLANWTRRRSPFGCGSISGILAVHRLRVADYEDVRARVRVPRSLFSHHSGSPVLVSIRNVLVQQVGASHFAPDRVTSSVRLWFHKFSRITHSPASNDFVYVQRTRTIPRK